jgi:phage protein U
MAIEIAGIKFPRVHRILTLEQAAFVYHHIPGQEGNATQNLGRDSVRLQIEGIFYGATAGESLDKLRGVFLKREAVDFIDDILGTSYTGKVTVDRLEVTQAAQEPDQFSYLLVVAEYVPPPQQEMGTEAIDAQVN